MKDFFKKLGGLIKKNRKQIIKILVIALVIGGIAVGGYFILKACGFTTAEDFRRLRDTIGDNIWFWLIIFALQVFQTVAIPISNQAISAPIAIVFNNSLWKVWLVSWLGIWVGTIILYFIGRLGGDKLFKWVLGDEKQVEKCKRWLCRGKAFYILGMLLPLPDDVITTLAGAARYEFSFVAIASLFTRAVDVACTVWGFGYLTKFWWGWLILAVGAILLLLATWLMFKWDKKKTIEEKKMEEQNGENI